MMRDANGVKTQLQNRQQQRWWKTRKHFEAAEELLAELQEDRNPPAEQAQLQAAADAGSRAEAEAGGGWLAAGGVRDAGRSLQMQSTIQSRYHR